MVGNLRMDCNLESTLIWNIRQEKGKGKPFLPSKRAALLNQKIEGISLLRARLSSLDRQYKNRKLRKAVLFYQLMRYEILLQRRTPLPLPRSSLLFGDEIGAQQYDIFDCVYCFESKFLFHCDYLAVSIDIPWIVRWSLSILDNESRAWLENVQEID